MDPHFTDKKHSTFFSTQPSTIQKDNLELRLNAQANQMQKNKPFNLLEEEDLNVPKEKKRSILQKPKTDKNRQK